MNTNFETILDVCVSEIAEGRSSLDECLARYPEYAAQLKPLLGAATRLTRARAIMPDPAYKARARAQLNIHMQRHPQRRRVSPILWRFSIAFATVMLLFLASGIAFAQGARPGDTLYNWKLTSEYVWRMTSADPLGVDLALSDRRMNELVWAARSGDELRQARALERYEKVLLKLYQETDEADRARILPVLQLQSEILAEAGVLVPALEAYTPK